MKVKVTGILLCVMMFCISIFSGCSLVTLDKNRYLNETVASVVDKENPNFRIDITKKELISAYNSYGYYYTQYYNYTSEKAIEQTLNLLINRKITITEAEKIYSDGLSEAEKTYLWQETADALESNFKSYLNDVLGITNSSSNSESEDRVFTPYIPNAKIDGTNGGIEIIKTSTPQKAIDNFEYTIPRDIDTKADKDLIYTNFITFVNTPKSEAYSKAFNNYLKALKDNEDGMGLSTDTMGVFIREIERLYKVNYENFMIEKYDEYFTNYSDVSTISEQQILDMYTSMVRSSYAQYQIENDSAYESNMQSDSTKIYYYKEGAEDTQFFQVAHVLLKFNDEQTNDYKTIQTRKTNGYYTDEASYNQAIEDLCSKIVPIVRYETTPNTFVTDSSKVKEDYEKTAYSLANWIKEQVDRESTTQDKINKFREFIYKYNDDPGMINAANNYTIGVNKSEAEDGEEYKVYSSYVQEFTDMAVTLYSNGNGQVGDVSTPVVTENGIHVLFYVGMVDNLFKNINSGFSLTYNEKDPITGLVPIEVLANTKVNIFNNKTYFDVVYDSLVTDNFAVFQNLNMNELRKGYNLNTYPDAYKDLIND